MSLLVTGSIGIDTVEAPSGSVKDALGGSSVYFAYASSFFAHTRLVGVVGEDCPAGFLKPLEDNDQIDMEGLEVRQGSKTFRWHGRYHEDVNSRDTLEVDLNVLAEVGPTIPGNFTDSEFVFLANTHPDLQMELLGQLSEPKLVVADTMDLWIQTQHDSLLKLLSRIDGLVLNDAEACMLTEKKNIVAAGIECSRLVKQFVIVKKGEHGSILFVDGKVLPMPGFPAAQVVDPTGAGDSFAGAMMGYLAVEDRVDVDALKWAIAYGTVTASFEIEDFSLNRFLQLSRTEIDARTNEYRQNLSF